MTGTRKVLVDSEKSNNLLYIPVDPNNSVKAPDLTNSVAAGIASPSSTDGIASPTQNSVNSESRQTRPMTSGQARESRE
jgi:hypothetical protein